MIVDYHHHLQSGEGYLDRLIGAMDACGIDKVCLNGLGIGKGRGGAALGRFGLGDLSPDNGDVLAAYAKYPDRVIPIGVINLGVDGPGTVDRLYEDGFKGLKITRPRDVYCADPYMPVYARAQALRLPILFHTGMVLVTPFDQEDDVSSLRMSPMTLDRVARRFPALHITLAHMGMPWLQEAAVMARFHENVYLDLTASPKGWRSQLTGEEFKRLLYWDGALDKLVFGTDVAEDGIALALNQQEALIRSLGASGETQARFFAGNALSALSMEE